MSERYVQPPIPELAHFDEEAREKQAMRQMRLEEELARHAFFAEIYTEDEKEKPDEEHNYLFD